MSDILEILKVIEGRLTAIEGKLGIVEQTSEKMSDHINFVENVYRVVRRPLNFIKNQVLYIGGGNDLPKIKNND